jgi:AmiR/NasT family two-component response regulator
MSYRETEHLRVLIANERQDRLALVAPIVASLGHEVIARSVDVNDVGAVTARERPDVALVGLGESSDHALMLIEKIVQESACPVIVLIHAADPEFVREASKRGIFAYITDGEGTDWQGSIDIVLRRFAEYHDLEGAFGRRATIERAKAFSWSVTRSTGRRLRPAARPLACGEPQARRHCGCCRGRARAPARAGARAGRLALAATGFARCARKRRQKVR